MNKGTVAKAAGSEHAVASVHGVVHNGQLGRKPTKSFAVDFQQDGRQTLAHSTKRNGAALDKLTDTGHHTASSMVRSTHAPGVVSTEDSEPANTGRGPAETSSSDLEGVSRVIYIGQLPHGFYEEQLKGFFDQFGLVTRLRVSRNKKTGKAKHYAFVEFQSPEVAVIAAEAMDNYMMFKQKLRVNVVKAADLHPQLFKGANKKFRAIPTQKLSRDQHNRERTAEEDGLRVKKAVAKDKQRQQRIKAAGIDYEYEPLQALMPATPTHKKFK